MRRTTARLTQVIIDDFDKRVGPAEVLGGSGEAILTRRTFTMRKHLVQGRLADIHQGLAAEVMGLDFRVVGSVHEITSIRGMDWRVMVAINLTPAASAGPEGAPLLSAATSMGR